MDLGLIAGGHFINWKWCVTRRFHCEIKNNLVGKMNHTECVSSPGAHIVGKKVRF